MSNLKCTIIALSLLISLINPNSGLSSSPYLKVHFLNVGQGDSIFIQSPNGRNVLIDAGEKEYGPGISNYLRNQGVQKLDLLIATHPHADHIGGMTQIVREFEIGLIYMPYISNNTAIFQDLLLAIQQKKEDILFAKAGAKINLDQALDIVFLAPGGDAYGNINDYSAVIKITFKQTSFLLCGDAGIASEEEILSLNTELHADVIKIAHHGSSTSTSIRFLERVRPELAIISVGRGNAFGLPSTELIRRLAAFNIGILRTDINGTIILTSDGDRIWLEESK